MNFKINDIFAPPEEGSEVICVPMRLLRRHGQPFLFLPANRQLAARSLSLYAAQTQSARAARTLLRFGLRLGISARLENLTLAIAAADPFSKYLSQVVEQGARRSPEPLVPHPPPFAMLAGNPNTGAQRCIFLLFDSDGQPLAVVKAGSGEAARGLIQQEQTFLKAVPAGTPAVPAVRSSFESDRVSAFTTDFFPGDSPRGRHPRQPEELLSSWVDATRTVTIGDLCVWKKLLASANEQLPIHTRQLASAALSPTIFHGDFAPWNIKVSPSTGNWTVVDWERGQLEGLPVWDWLHFIVQPAILVEHASQAAILERIESLFISAPFVRYAALAKVQGLERALAMAYFHHCLHVLRQTEGLPTIQALAKIAAQRWSSQLTI